MFSLYKLPWIGFLPLKAKSMSDSCLGRETPFRVIFLQRNLQIQVLSKWGSS